MLSREPDPDFDRLLKAFTRDGIPDRVPLYELLIDGEVVTKLTDKPFR